MALFTESIDDEISVESVTVIALDDGTGVAFEVMLFDDDLQVEDDVNGSGLRGIFIADTLSVTDALSRDALATRTRSDTVLVADSLKRVVEYERQLNDTINVTDQVVGAPVVSFLIDEARALTPTRVRIDFAAPALADASLTQPSNYRFNNLSPGSVDVVPLSVRLPAGQPSPIYVEIETTEHTDEGTYEVALTPAIRGAAGEIGSTIPAEYEGIGVAPTLRVVIALSPTEVEVHFSEEIRNESDANNRLNYTWDNGLQTVAVQSVAGSVVTLQTTQQTSGVFYTLTVSGTQPSFDKLINDDIDVEDDLLAELFTFDVHISDDIELDADTIDAQIPPPPPIQLAMAVARYLAPADVTGVQSSLDGITWIDEASSFFSPEGRPLYRAAYGNGVNLIVGGSVVYTSGGHGTWAAQYGFPEAQCVTFSPELGIFVVGGHNSFLVSADGFAWNSFPADVSPFDVYFWSIVWSPELGLFVAGGNDGDLIQTSPDGMAWTRRAQGGGFFGLWWGMAWNPGAGLFVAAGGNSAAPDALQTSPDGVTWTPRTPGSGYTGNWLGAASSPTRFVVIGWNGTPEVQTSDDGITWTQRTLDGGYTGTPYGVTYRADLGLFMLCGDGGEIQTSPDGVTWTHRALGGGITDALFRGVA